jgi:hypothetical protein
MIDAPRGTGRPISLRTVGCCIWCIFAVACLGFADSVPLATYTLTFQAGIAPLQTITNTVVPNTVASIIKQVQSASSQSTGQALAETFTPLFVQAQGDVDVQETAPPTSLAVGSTILYYFQVEQTAPAPVDLVPLLIQSNVEADASSAGTGAANAFADFLIPDLNISHPEVAICNGATCTSSSSMSFTDSPIATAGQNIQVQILATGDAGAIGMPNCCGGHATFKAIADPTIQIDPSFAYADDFTLAFSSNLPPAVPEPSSIALFATGLLALMALVCSSGLRRRFED